jgi:hypothetical protein
MARDRTQIQRRNSAIKDTFSKLSKGRCAKWRTHEIIKEVADMFFLTAKTIENILSS